MAQDLVINCPADCDIDENALDAGNRDAVPNSDVLTDITGSENVDDTATSAGATADHLSSLEQPDVCFVDDAVCMLASRPVQAVCL